MKARMKESKEPWHDGKRGGREGMEIDLHFDKSYIAFSFLQGHTQDERTDWTESGMRKGTSSAGASPGRLEGGWCLLVAVRKKVATSCTQQYMHIDTMPSNTYSRTRQGLIIQGKATQFKARQNNSRHV